MHLLTNFSLEIWVGLLYVKEAVLRCWAESQNMWNVLRPILLHRFVLVGSQLNSGKISPFFNSLLPWSSLGWWVCGIQFEGCAHTKILLRTMGNVEQIGNLTDHSSFCLHFFPFPCSLYNKENSAWRARGLEAKLAKMKTGLSQQGFYCSLALPWQRDFWVLLFQNYVFVHMFLI